jgi:hypothetical protein
MTTFNFGNANPTASGVPGVVVNVQPPPSAPLTGAPSDILALAGVASWGPVGVQVAFSDEAGAAVAFGPMANRKYDLSTGVHAAAMNGAGNFRGVRVTDGTETAAAAQIGGGTGLAVTAKYTGSLGAGIKVQIGPGTKPSTKRVVISMPGHQAEVIDNIAATAASNASWLALRDAINTNSSLVVTSAGALATAPADGTFPLAGGSDGASGVTTTMLVGSDTVPRTGMYALRSSGAAVFFLVDCDDSATYAAQTAFAKSEMAYGFGSSPSGDTTSAFATGMAGQDDPWFKVLFGDWTYILDGVNKITRLIAPSAVAAGRKVSLGPQNSLLNKPIYGIIGTQSSLAGKVWDPAQLQLIGQARGDIITMSSPGGEYPSCAFGHNSSSDQATRQDTYTGMTNYLARSFDTKAGTGRFIGRNATAEEAREAQSTIGSFLQLEWDAERIGNAAGTLPYSVEIDNAAILQGIQKAKVRVQYLAVIETFLIDLTGGQTVQIASQSPLV